MIMKALKLGLSVLLAVIVLRLVGFGFMYGLLELIRYVDKGF